MSPHFLNAMLGAALALGAHAAIAQPKPPAGKAPAVQLSKQDIDDLAAWFASQKSPLHDQR